eukprot:gnl/Chilomastix_caulleri/2966.p1 GENE.gnl/Chilomastix_caulleri/2966~~gnl/Chilomastix_caulleri/2966.p1  ORF type:complete len:208 (-),score=46.90 gnl/Chilomastix_caulleri/2966:11-634(-)
MPIYHCGGSDDVKITDNASMRSYMKMMTASLYPGGQMSNGRRLIDHPNINHNGSNNGNINQTSLTNNNLRDNGRMNNESQKNTRISSVGGDDEYDVDEKETVELEVPKDFEKMPGGYPYHDYTQLDNPPVIPLSQPPKIPIVSSSMFRGVMSSQQNPPPYTRPGLGFATKVGDDRQGMIDEVGGDVNDGSGVDSLPLSPPSGPISIM